MGRHSLRKHGKENGGKTAMGQIIPFPQAREESDELYLEEMSREQLCAYLAQLQQRLAQLDLREPKAMQGEAYEAWADEHEALEDAIDEVCEFLDER